MPNVRLQRTRDAYRPCEIGEKAHAFIDTVNGNALNHAFRDGVQDIERICSGCGAKEADILAKATPEHVGEILPDGVTANVIEGEEHESGGTFGDCF